MVAVGLNPEAGGTVAPETTIAAGKSERTKKVKIWSSCGCL